MDGPDTDVWASARPDGHDEEWIGIDLGTTNSVVAVWKVDKNRAKVLRDPNTNAKTSPSVVNLFRDAAGAWTHATGSEAAAQATSFPSSTVVSVKRLMGCYESDPGVRALTQTLPYRVVPCPRGAEEDLVLNPAKGRPAYVEVDYEGHTSRYSPQAISALVLGGLRRRAEAALGHPVEKAVIAVPAHFNDRQRKATRVASMLAGFREIRLLAEPTAAAMAYGLFVAGTKTVCVFDLGGGTFDVSVLRVVEGRMSVLAVGGDSLLGGDDVTRGLVAAKLAELKREHHGRVPPPQSAGMQALREAVEQAKQALSADPGLASAALEVPDIYNGFRFESSVTQAELQAVAEPLYARCMQILGDTLREAGHAAEDIDEVVMVGGCTRAVELQDRVSAFFGGKELCTGVDPDLAVGEGAAVQAALLSGVKKGHLQDVLMMDALPHDIGVELADGTMKVVLPRNSPIPASSTEFFALAEDGQEGITVEVFEGPEPLARDNKWLGYLNLRVAKTRRHAGSEHAVTFRIDESGVLQIRQGTEAELSEQAANGEGEEGEEASDKVPIALLGYLLVLFVLYVAARIWFAEHREAVNPPSEHPMSPFAEWDAPASAATAAAPAPAPAPDEFDFP